MSLDTSRIFRSAGHFHKLTTGFLLGALLLAVVSCKSTRSRVPQGDFREDVRPPPAPLDPKFIPLRAGETVDIYVLEDPGLNGTYTVRNEGHIILPTMGRVQLAGLTPSKAEARLKELLEASKLRAASVILDRTSIVGSAPEATTQKVLVYITGKVARPGQHNISVEMGRSMGVYEAVLISGGFARFSNESKAYILRQTAAAQPKRRIDIDLKAVAEGRVADIPIRAGDIVHVPEKVFGF
jgi:protein involved in polysaccharide export with SLBB domain